MLASGAGALFLAAVLPWSWVYTAMAGLLLIGVLTTLLAPEPTAATVATPSAELLGRLREAVVAPFVEFLRRQGVVVAVVVLVFIVLYTLGDAFAGTMANPFYLQVGFSKVQIAAVAKSFWPRRHAGRCVPRRLGRWPVRRDETERADQLGGDHYR
jgi:PAT family beta-lactamase induction signal transducer AmpG